MMNMFQRTVGKGDRDVFDGPALRSSTHDDDDDWLIDDDAVDVSTTNHRRLSRYPIEQLLVSPEKSKLLLLVNVKDDDLVFGGNANKINLIQQNHIATIGGKRFIPLKCVLSGAACNLCATGGTAGGLYTEKRFINDWKTRKGDFQVSFPGTEKVHTFNWREIVEGPSTFMFFGAPLTMTRSFDSIFQRCTEEATLHHRFINHYDEFEGDVISCLSLYNSYLHRRLSVACADEKKAVAKVTKKIYDGGLFRTPRVVEFLNEFDTLITTKFERALTEFQDYSEPIIKTPDFM